MLLGQCEAVAVAGREVADIQLDHVEADDLQDLALGQESIGDPALVEDLDRACVQATRAPAGEILARASLDNRDVDARQGQLARQHQARRASSGDHHRVLRHRPRLYGTTRDLRQAPLGAIRL